MDKENSGMNEHEAAKRRFSEESDEVLDFLQSVEASFCFSRSRTDISVCVRSMVYDVLSDGKDKSTNDDSVRRAIGILAAAMNECPVTNTPLGRFSKKIARLFVNWNLWVNGCNQEIDSMCKLIDRHGDLAYSIAELLDEVKRCVRFISVNKSGLMPAVSLSKSYLDSIAGE